MPIRLDEIAVAFVEPLYEINIGYVARCMKNFGLSRLILVKPRCRVGDEAFRFAMHGREVLERARLAASLEELVEEFDLVVGTTGVQTKELSHVRRWITPEDLAKRVAEYEGTVLIVLGREDRGLTNAELAMCDIVVTIPANPEYPILNVSHAAVVIFYELFKRAASVKPPLRLPRREEVNTLLHYLRGLVLILGGSRERAEKACLMMRRLLGGAPPTDSDVRMLLGVFRGAYERLRSGERPL
ncbi:MAG: RNA methyltransferase [Thermoprotei archaeon]|nr:MAG: RNA methyltransferase [Thermoprotei archaeon]